MRIYKDLPFGDTLVGFSDDEIRKIRKKPKIKENEMAFRMDIIDFKE